MKKKKTLWGLAAAAGLTLLAGIGLLEKADLRALDLWYQTRRPTGGEVVMVEIDDRALEVIGPYEEWGRGIMAQVIETLNQSEECRPAAIGLDVLYTGEKDPENDAWLAEAAGAYDNVVTACAAVFGDSIENNDDGSFYVNTFSVQMFDEPYEALREAADLGHINAMLDTDGVLRHHLLKYTLPDGREIPSMALRLAEKYREYYGEKLEKLPPMDEHGFWHVPFYGVPGDFDESISVADVLTGAVPPEYFAGKLVFIGPYAVGFQDSFITAADHAAPMYGMEFQANAAQALLSGEFVFKADERLQLAVLFLTLLGTFYCFWRQPVFKATAVWLLTCGGYLGITKWLYARGTILHVLWIPVGVTILYVGCIAYNYISAALEKRRITNTFKRYTAPEIVNEILEQGEAALELGGRLTNIAVLFVDVRGFTPMSELLKPTEVVEILNRYLTLISDCIMRNHGTLDKFVGDAAMAFWGAPISQEDYVMHAVQAARDMVKGSEALSKELMEKYGRTVSFGIGVHAGEAVVGNIGSPQRMDYTAIGDTVNTAARLEANAPGGTIYSSRAVADALEGRICVTSLGDSVKLKGKKAGFEVLILEEIKE